MKTITNEPNSTAARLRLLRGAVFGESCSDFARRLVVSVQRLSNMENGSPLSISVANKIRAAAPGMSLDWLYHGDERALPHGNGREATNCWKNE